MPTLEESIKDVAKKSGADLVGLAGPGRFNGPPSINPAYIMRGAKSIVSVVVGWRWAYYPALVDQSLESCCHGTISADIVVLLLRAYNSLLFEYS